MADPTVPLSRHILPWLGRKLAAAAVATAISAVFLPALFHFASGSPSWADALTSWLFGSFLLLLYAAPFNFVYGVACSMLIELTLFRLLHRRPHAPISLLLHALCGFWALPLLFGALSGGWLGALCAALFFFADLTLASTGSRRKRLGAALAFLLLLSLVPLCVSLFAAAF
ncbi:hypothetical protein I8J29_15450 [Paenibacillus sp. MWE-103]|uniref:Yip1 domain-containing protein n=1 Tax=Paenibacillus artemisiicola TaxID=1172618 RepID=A0ABS3WBB1_9BACL|nr:hypothetical protein [Paenibacillus artemisiicola]MBO7745605.1 hypothetical protein [Paenibacillus artemisiicola]